MKLDVIVGTYNRAAQLERLLESLERASTPDDLEPSITLVDNNSSDQTRDVVAKAQRSFKTPIHYVLEPRQGQSFARNTGIAFTSGDLVAFVDDDEEIGQAWYEEIQSAFADPGLDFAGGPYVPKWGAELPKWAVGHVTYLLGSYDFGPE